MDEDRVFERINFWDDKDRNNSLVWKELLRVRPIAMKCVRYDGSISFWRHPWYREGRLIPRWCWNLSLDWGINAFQTLFMKDSGRFQQPLQSSWMALWISLPLKIIMLSGTYKGKGSDSVVSWLVRNIQFLLSLEYGQSSLLQWTAHCGTVYGIPDIYQRWVVG